MILLCAFVVFTSSTFHKASKSENIQTLSKADLIELSKSNEKVLIYAWASWWKPHAEKIPELVKLSKEQNRTIYFISVEEDGTKCHDLLMKNGFEGTSYQLNPKQFKLEKWNKVQIALKRVLGAKDDSHYGLPQNYLFENSELQKYKVGALNFD